MEEKRDEKELAIVLEGEDKSKSLSCRLRLMIVTAEIINNIDR